MDNNADHTDEVLIARLRSGQNSEAAGMLFMRYKLLIFGVCMKYLKNQHDAEDAMMEVFIKFTDKIKTHDVDKLKSWLYVLTKNYCLEKIRKDKVRNIQENPQQDMYSEPLLHLDEKEEDVLMVKLEYCMETLSDIQRICLNAFYYKKLSYHQIAETENISWNSVRSYIQNGRRKLKHCIEQQ